MSTASGSSVPLRCRVKTCRDYGDPSFGEGTCPADHAEPWDERGAAAGGYYRERGQWVRVLRGWRGKGPRNVLIRRSDGTCAVRPFRGLRRG